MKLTVYYLVINLSDIEHVWQQVINPSQATIGLDINLKELLRFQSE